MCTKMHNKSIVSEVIVKVFKDLFEIDIDEFLFDTPILGKEIRLNARDLVYLYYEINSIWNINIPEEDIILNKFTTINSIISIICNELKCQSGCVAKIVRNRQG